MAGLLGRRANHGALAIAILLSLAALLVASTLPRVSGTSSALKAVPFIPPQHFINTNANRVVDLAVPTIVREGISVTAKNVASGSESEYYVAVDSDAADQRVAYLGAVVKGEKTQLVVEKGQYDGTKAAQFFKIVLPKPVPAGETVQLQITIVSTHSTENYPAKIGQADKASRLYTGNLHFLSPYKTDKEKLTIKTAAGKVHSHTPSTPTVSGNQYSYSSSDVAAFSREQVRIHFEVPAPMLKAESVKRTIEVSHWTSKAEFSEDWILWHDGPRLKDPFNRIDYSKANQYRMESSTVANQLLFVFPAGAVDAWYRDVDGNISTSHFRTEATRSIMEMKPRYPIYGGWKFSWSHGYEVPQTFQGRGIVQLDSKTGKYVLKAKVHEGLKNVPVEKWELEIILPEGATDVQVALPFKAESEEVKTTYSYFDTIGKPTFLYRKKNLVDDAWTDKEVVVTYNLGSTSWFRKPLVISTGILAFLVAVSILGRVDTTIVKS